MWLSWKNDKDFYKQIWSDFMGTFLNEGKNSTYSMLAFHEILQGTDLYQIVSIV